MIQPLLEAIAPQDSDHAVLYRAAPEWGAILFHGEETVLMIAAEDSPCAVCNPRYASLSAEQLCLHERVALHA